MRVEVVLDLVHDLFGLGFVVVVVKLVGHIEPLVHVRREHGGLHPAGEQGSQPQTQRSHDDRGGPDPVAQRPVQHANVALFHPDHRSAWLGGFLAQQMCRHQRDQQQRRDERTDQRQRDRDPHLAEPDHQIGIAEDQRQEDDEAGQRRGHHGHGHRPRALQRCLLRVGLVDVAPIDGFQDHDRVVHQHAHAEHQPHHREQVQRLTHEVHQAAGRDDREGDRERYDQRGVHAPQEEIEHEDGHHRADQTGLAQPVQTLRDVLGLIFPDEQLDALQQRVVVDLLFDDPGHVVYDLDRVRGGFLEDFHRDGVLAVQVAAVGQRWFFVLDLGDVAQLQTGLIDREIADGFDAVEGAQRAG